MVIKVVSMANKLKKMLPYNNEGGKQKVRDTSKMALVRYYGALEYVGCDN